MNDQSIQSIMMDWSKIDRHSYLRKLKQLKN